MVGVVTTLGFLAAFVLSRLESNQPRLLHALRGHTRHERTRANQKIPSLL